MKSRPHNKSSCALTLVLTSVVQICRALDSRHPIVEELPARIRERGELEVLFPRHEVIKALHPAGDPVQPGHLEPKMMLHISIR
ncbi:hypothetical protein EHI46_24965 [Rhizobium leguminosarum]|nr:hypothetical protein EHI46_24965 [Rhizobium leguminosarum]